ncbi:MAG: septation protein IspZ [Casimicrobiaceae bacterium]
MKRAGYVVLFIVGIIVLPWLLRRFAPSFAYAIPVVVNLALGAAFALTQRRGSEPMIARFARAERGALEPDLAVHARRLTWVWVAYFAAAAAGSVLLAASGHVRLWIAFTSFGNYVVAVTLFVGEFYYRRRHFAQYEHARPLAMLAHVRAVLRDLREPVR